ncbi:branched-chain amino acid ABC transporter permease [Catellatospora chokoriensis]|uniref:Branched-chain amino acid ABC transporter permease n=1 Tax=Catellatospora chokoriensis TaxID=310353 RepID=A0A8J3JYU2_9ACTN|nr:branched-chain amino acid ABC transporter permease [Catellatospora chokoriensis]GIF90959.1 branched-chain amino acid ABC transporter permease [Catellatospora chokoriensis]
MSDTAAAAVDQSTEVRAPAGAAAPVPADASARGGTIVPRWLRWSLAGAALLVALWLPNGLYPTVAVDIACWALFAVAVDLLLGYTGLMSFGHAAFWGTSAYATGLAAINWGLPFPVAVLLGALAAVVLAIPVGYLAVKRVGIYFAMVTLAFAQMVYYIANQWRSVTQGENGLQRVPRELFGLDLTDEYYFYYAALPIVAGGLFLVWRAVHSPFGRVLVAIRDNPARARALGYPVHRYKLAAFLLSAFTAGLGGGLFAIGHRFVSLDVLHWTTSGKAVIIVVLGGIGTLWGPVVGAAGVTRLEDWLSFAGFEQIGLVTGAIFVLAVLIFRRGLWGTVTHWLRRRG